MYGNVITINQMSGTMLVITKFKFCKFVFIGFARMKLGITVM